MTPDEMADLERQAGFTQEVDERLSGGAGLPRFLTEPDLDKNYFDLPRMFPGPDVTYRDYEGMTSPDNTMRLLQEPLVVEAIHIYTERDEGRDPLLHLPEEFFRTMLAHYAYENEDQGDYTINVNEAVTFIHTVAMIFATRFWMKVSAE